MEGKRGSGRRAFTIINSWIKKDRQTCRHLRNDQDQHLISKSKGTQVLVEKKEKLANRGEGYQETPTRKKGRK